MLTAGATAIGLFIFSTLAGALPNPDPDPQGEFQHSDHTPAGTELAFRAAPVEVPRYNPDPADLEISKVKSAFAEGLPGNPKTFVWNSASDRRRAITKDDDEDQGEEHGEECDSDME